MKIKKYEVTDMKEALRLIKQDLGPEAVILTTRKIMKPAGLGLFPKPILQVTAAIDYDGSIFAESGSTPTPSAKQEQKIKTEELDIKFLKNVLPPDPTKGLFKKTEEANLSEESYKSNDLSSEHYVQDEPKLEEQDLAVDPIHFSSSSRVSSLFSDPNLVASLSSVDERVAPVPEEEIPDKKVDLHNISNIPKEPAEAPKTEATADNLFNVLSSMGLSSIATDIGEIKRQLNEMKAAASEPVSMGVDLEPALKEIYSVLLRNGLDELLSYRFLKGIEKDLPIEPTSKARIKGMVIDRICEAIPIEKGYLDIMKGKIMGFIGPTGVGKTTTIAKIAADLVLKQNKRVCLITVDNFRVGAIEQLKNYAEIVKLPLYVASGPADLNRLLTNIYKDYDFILLDSTGRSPYDLNKLNEAAQYLNSFSGIIPILVLSMASNHIELGEMYERYSGLDPKYLIFTKLDETRYFGPLVNIPVKKKIPLFLLSVGQSVPDDLEIPDGKKIARKLLQEIPVLWNDN